MDMKRRNFVKSVASLPFAPSISDLDGKNKYKKGHWEFSSGWFDHYDWGRTIIVEDDEILYDWDFEDRETWHKTTLLNAHQVANCEYVTDLSGLDMRALYIDSPYFSTLFENEWNEVQIRQGKYSEHEYTYHVETHDEDGLHVIEGGSDSIESLVEMVSEKINR